VEYECCGHGKIRAGGKNKGIGKTLKNNTENRKNK
jgi:hypothetical protein